MQFSRLPKKSDASALCSGVDPSLSLAVMSAPHKMRKCAMATFPEAVNYQDKNMKNLTYQSTLLPAPAVEGKSNQFPRLC